MRLQAGTPGTGGRFGAASRLSRLSWSSMVKVEGISGGLSFGVGGPSIGVARSRPLYYRDVHNGRNEFWADEFAGNRTHADATDSFRYLAKVRVAGSNPVVRSNRSRSGRCTLGWIAPVGHDLAMGWP